MEDISLELLLILVGMLANGFFAGSEIALVSARVGRLAELRQQGVTGAATAMRLKESPEAFLATIQIAITALGTLASVVGGATAVGALIPWLAALGLGRWAEPAALGFVILAITYVSLVIGELAPKAVALRNPDRLAALVAPVIFRLSRVSSRLVSLLTLSTNGILRVFGVRPGGGSPFVSEEEVRYLVREGAAKGIFERVEEELVHNVFEFADTTVREIMVPPMAIKALDIATPPVHVLSKAAEIGHSRIPVCRGSIEQVVGVVVLKDLLRCAARAEPAALETLIHPPLFVPESSRISVVLREFQRTRQNLAMVVDEYGAIAGLVTVEDVLEEIVGEIREEHELPVSSIARLSDGSVLIDGQTRIDEVRDVGIPISESPDYTTVAGFVIASLGTIPGAGASFTHAGHRWIVMETAGPRVSKVRVEQISMPG
jgi:putative hemolysin